MVGLTFVAITKKHDLSLRAHVNFPAQTDLTLYSVVLFPSTLGIRIRIELDPTVFKRTL